MEVNEINKQLYEAAFIQNGEYGYHDNEWKPSIDERQIDNYCDDGEGYCIPATPLGYREYSKSRLQGLQNILDQHPCVDLTGDKYYHINREDNVIKLYDKVKINNDDFFVVCGDDEDCFYVVNGENKRYFVNYESK